MILNNVFIYEQAMSELTHKQAGGVAYVERQGSGAPLVCLHGIGSNEASFSPLFDVLPGDLHLIAWNAPGYLGSAPIAEPWPQPPDYAKALTRFLDAAGFEKINLLGHSLGTLIATEFARTMPERIDRLVLASAAQGYGISPEGRLPGHAASRIQDLRELGPAIFARSRAPKLVFEPLLNPDVVAHVEAGMSQVNLDGYTQAVRMLSTGNLSKTIKDVPIRPGFIVGIEDTITPVDQTRGAAAAWTEAYGLPPRIIEIAGAGHASYAQKPEEFAAALIDLLNAPAHREGDQNVG